MKKLVKIGLVGFIPGLLCALLCGTDFLQDQGILLPAQLKAYANCQINFVALFIYLLMTRIRFLCLFALLSTLPARKLIPPCFTLTASACFGWFSGSCVLTLKGFGILFLLSALLPHTLFYLTDFALIYHTHRSFDCAGHLQRSALLLRILLILCVFLLGCISETILSAPILQILLRNIPLGSG